MEFEVIPVARESDRVLQVLGELDVATVGQLRDAVQSALAQHPTTLLVDLTGTRFIDSTGCRELIRCAKAGTRDGVAVAIVAPAVNWRVRRVIDLVQLSALVPVHDDVPAP